MMWTINKWQVKRRSKCLKCHPYDFGLLVMEEWMLARQYHQVCKVLLNGELRVG